MYKSPDWDYYATEGYYFIYWNFWDVAWPFASKENIENPWWWDSYNDDWYAKWDDIKAVYHPCYPKLKPN